MAFLYEDGEVRGSRSVGRERPEAPEPSPVISPAQEVLGDLTEPTEGWATWRLKAKASRPVHRSAFQPAAAQWRRTRTPEPYA